ncbi:N-acyl-L-amino acid amidohydrolase [Rheinheimera sp. SA_1]|uniref:amidohydrolase n=1 Tax=Rheinheimera sp. SA_1 TaxID=1827365 RepID=UPI00080104BD|nr:amidohydrolase [Rheinheimera sp. SA_1]OBP16199.1 N-acyl-L-amino acid amidohydrolase [Rheinheimera sp. SA_1]
MRLSLIAIMTAATLSSPALFAADLKATLATDIQALMPKVIEWRRDLHQHPELSNREFRTSKLVAAELKKLGLEVQTGIAHTGVVAILKGAKPGPMVALRADMDALPVKEQVDLPFASKATAEYNGQQVGVMHACGHDAHVAMLLGAATVLSKQQKQLAGSVMFIFQPAEEGAPAGEEGGASLMLKQGLFAKTKPDAIFGVHVWPAPTGQLQVKAEGIMAAADSFEIKVKGVQVHGSSPWRGIDPVAVSGQLITALHQIPARQLDVTQAPAVMSIGQVHGGVRWNIIPDEVVLGGTVRTFDPQMREQLLAKMKHTAEHIAAASGATAEFHQHSFAAVTWNDVKLTEWAMPSLTWAAGKAGVSSIKPITASEDFSFYQQQVPGVFFFLGIAEEGADLSKTAPNHSPFFRVNEAALENGVRALSGLAVDFLHKN